MSGICFVMPAFMKKKNCEKSYIRLNHFQTHLSNCSKQPAKQMKTLTLPQNPHINGHDGDHYTADEEDQLMTLSMLQEKFQDDEMEFLATMVAPEDLTVYTVYKSKLKMFRFQDMILLV